MTTRHITDAERRARLARRHALHPDHRLDGPSAVGEALVAYHATEPSTVHLAYAARARTPRVADVEASLYDERSIVKQLAMRRTLWAFPRDLLPAVLGSASRRVAATTRAALVRDLERDGVADDGAAWVERARTAVLGRLGDGSALGAARLRQELPELAGRTAAVENARTWEVPQSFAPRLLTVMGAEGLICRGANDGHWRASRPAWTAMQTWLGERVEPLDERAGYAELVRRWLARFGPGTEADLVWWLGATKASVRRALTDVDAVAVCLDSGQTGYVLPGDEGPVDDPGEWAALLPTLDPTTMGWRGRDFHLDPAHARHLFDSNGNGGTTAWLDGRIVGAWVQDADARVQVVPLTPLGARDRARLDEQAERLTGVLDGVVIANVYKSALMKGERLP